MQSPGPTGRVSINYDDDEEGSISSPGYSGRRKEYESLPTTKSFDENESKIVLPTSLHKNKKKSHDGHGHGHGHGHGDKKKKNQDEDEPRIFISSSAIDPLAKEQQILLGEKTLEDAEKKKRGDRKAQISLLIATLFTLIFMVVEIVGGYIAGSLAIMTDAAHLLTDVAAMCLSLFAMQLSKRKPTNKLSYGYYRAEILGALASVLLIWALIGILIYEAILRLNGDAHLTGEVVDGRIMTFLGCAGLLVNIIDAGILAWGNAPHGHSHGGGGGHGHSHGGHGEKKKKEKHGHGHGDKDKKKKKEKHGHGHGHGDKKKHKHDEHHDIEAGQGHGHDHGEKKKKKKKGHAHGGHAEEGNLNVRAALIHVIGDCIQSCGVIVAAVIIWVGNVETQGTPSTSKSYFNLADPIASLLFGIITLFTTTKIIRQILAVLMEQVPEGLDYTEIREELESLPTVETVHDLHIWSLTLGRTFITIHLSSDNYLETLRAAQRVVEKYSITHSTIQVDPTSDQCHFTPD